MKRIVLFLAIFLILLGSLGFVQRYLAPTWFVSTVRIDGAVDLNDTLDVEKAANFQSTVDAAGKITGGADADITGTTTTDSLVATDATLGGYVLELVDDWLSFTHPTYTGSGFDIGVLLKTKTIDASAASDAARPVMQIEQLDIDEPLFGFTANESTGYGTSVSTTLGDGAVVGPKAPSSAPGWEMAKMLFVKIESSGFYLPVYREKRP